MWIRLLDRDKITYWRHQTRILRSFLLDGAKPLPPPMSCSENTATEATPGRPCVIENCKCHSRQLETTEMHEITFVEASELTSMRKEK